MQPEEIAEVMSVQSILEEHGLTDGAHAPYLIAALIDWKHDAVPPWDGPDGLNPLDKPKGKRAKATEPEVPDDEPGF